MKPMIILPPDAMEEAEIEHLRENEICVVVAKDPNAVRFVDPIPAQSSRTEIERAAIELSRRVLRGGSEGCPTPGATQQLRDMWARILLEGDPLGRADD